MPATLPAVPRPVRRSGSARGGLGGAGLLRRSLERTDDGAGGVVLLAEGVVDLQQHLLLPLGDPPVAEDGGRKLVVAAVLEDASPHVEGLGRDAQTLRDLLQDLRARLAQAALDLAQVRVA